MASNCINSGQGSECAAVVVAAGRGQRTGKDVAKQYVSLSGKPMLFWSIETFVAAGFDYIVIVLPTSDVANVEQQIRVAFSEITSELICVPGGASRKDSVESGLNALPFDMQGDVFIHDAARPGVTLAVLDALKAALITADGAAPALAVSDALKKKKGDRIEALSRENVFRIQTPQAFRLEPFRRAMVGAPATALDDFEIAESAGLRLTFVPGDERFLKVTHPDDFELAADLIGSRNRLCRTGTGFDVHAFEPGDHLWLCGTRIAFDRSLKGHSDADVGWHAITDAILGAIAEGDIGDHFPPSDPTWKNASSEKFLCHASDLLRQKGGEIVNIDLTLICEVPKIKPHRQIMREATATALVLPLDRVSIKATTTERLGFLGREEGIAAQAVVTVAL